MHPQSGRIVLSFAAFIVLLLAALPVSAQGTPTPAPTPTAAPCLGGVDYLQSGSAALQARNYPTALESLNCHLEAFPEDANAYLLRATANISVERYEDAYEDASRVIEYADPDDLLYTAGHQIRANASYLLAEFETVIEDVTTLIELNEASEGGDPRLNMAVLYVLRGDAYLSLKDYDAARADYNAAVRADRRYAPAHAGLSLVAVAEGDRTTAQAQEEAAFTLDSDIYWPYYDRGVRFYRSGRYTAAIDEFTRAMALRPDVAARDYLLRGSAYYGLGEYEKALEDFENVTSIDPFNIDVYYGFALTYEAMEDYASALVYYDRLADSLRLLNQQVPELIMERIADMEARLAEQE
jgi:tetratricopeptide (TPR) repeat protein